METYEFHYRNESISIALFGAFALSRPWCEQQNGKVKRMLFFAKLKLSAANIMKDFMAVITEKYYFLYRETSISKSFLNFSVNRDTHAAKEIKRISFVWIFASKHLSIEVTMKQMLLVVTQVKEFKYRNNFIFGVLWTNKILMHPSH